MRCKYRKKDRLKVIPVLPISMSESGKAEKRSFIIMYIFPVKAGMLISVTSLRTISAAYYECSPPPACLLCSPKNKEF